MKKRSRRYIARKKNRYKVRLHFVGSDRANDLILNAKTFIQTPMIQIGDNQWALQEDEPVQQGNEWIYTVKLQQ